MDVWLDEQDVVSEDKGHVSVVGHSSRGVSLFVCVGNICRLRDGRDAAAEAKHGQGRTRSGSGFLCSKEAVEREGPSHSRNQVMV